MSESGVPHALAKTGVAIPVAMVQVGDEVRLEFGNGNYTTGTVEQGGDDTYRWRHVNSDNIDGEAYDPEFNGGRRRVVLLKRDGVPAEQVVPAEMRAAAVAVTPALPPGTRPELPIDWRYVRPGDEVRLEFDDHSADHPVTGVVQDSGDGLCVYTTADHGYQIDRPGRAVVLLRRAHEVALDDVLGTATLRAEYGAAAHVLLNLLSWGPEVPAVPEDPSLMLLALTVQSRVGQLLGAVEDNERACAVLADAGYTSNAPHPLAASVGEAVKAAKHLTKERQTMLGTASDFGLARSVVREAGFDPDESLASAVREMANRITELEKDNRMLAHDGQAWETKHATLVRADQQAQEASVVQRQALEGIREVLYAALPKAEPSDGYRSFPSWVGTALAEARRAGRPPVAGGDKPYSARLADIINRTLPGAPSVTVNERERLHDAILTEIYAHPGERLSRPAAAFLADQLMGDVGNVIDLSEGARADLRGAFITTAVEFFADGDDSDGAAPPTVEQAFAMLNGAVRDAGEELLRRWEDITRRKS